MGAGASAKEVPDSEGLQCANGRLYKGDRVQTEWLVEEGGDGRWYQGVCKRVTVEGRCKIVYDDGDSWTGDARAAYLVMDEPTAMQSIQEQQQPIVIAPVQPIQERQQQQLIVLAPVQLMQQQQQQQQLIIHQQPAVHMVGNADRVTRTLCGVFSAFSGGGQFFTSQQAMVALFHLGQAPGTSEEFARVFSAWDANGDGRVTIQEFLSVVNSNAQGGMMSFP
jgi:hypothetical protein